MAVFFSTTTRGVADRGREGRRFGALTGRREERVVAKSSGIAAFDAESLCEKRLAIKLAGLSANLKVGVHGIPSIDHCLISRFCGAIESRRA